MAASEGSLGGGGTPPSRFVASLPACWFIHRGVCRPAVPGGRRSTAAQTFHSPTQFMNSALERPVLHAFNQTFAHWVLLNIDPFLGVLFDRAHPRIPKVLLPRPLLHQMASAELALPKLDPLLERETDV